MRLFKNLPDYDFYIATMICLGFCQRRSHVYDADAATGIVVCIILPWHQSRSETAIVHDYSLLFPVP